MDELFLEAELYFEEEKKYILKNKKRMIRKANDDKIMYVWILPWGSKWITEITLKGCFFAFKKIIKKMYVQYYQFLRNIYIYINRWNDLENELNNIFGLWLRLEF